jgi:hypothetical protein
MNHWFADHLLITYLLIFVFMTYVFNKVFRTGKLTILKALLVYGLMAVGSYMLLFFQAAAGLPIVLSLGVAVFLMLLVRVRYFFEARERKKLKQQPKEN